MTARSARVATPIRARSGRGIRHDGRPVERCRDTAMHGGIMPIARAACGGLPDSSRWSSRDRARKNVSHWHGRCWRRPGAGRGSRRMQPPAVSLLVDPCQHGFHSVPATNARERPAVLVADDDEATRMELASVIRRKNCTVETATDLPGALRALARREFDLVFADVPAVGGDAALLGQMHEHRSGLPVVLMTSRATVA